MLRGHTKVLIRSLRNLNQNGNGDKNVMRVGVPPMGIAGWNGCAPAETIRGPRGLREVVVQDLDRLYRLRRTVS
jgi:hypothetical protein